MRRFANTAAIAAMLGIGSMAIVPPVTAQEYVPPRPLPRSMQQGSEGLRDLIEHAPGFDATAARSDDLGAAEGALLGAAELDDLVAPVALYPDTLLAQILVAATHPLDIVQADRLLDESDGLTDDELSVLIAEQDWDPSVMILLTGFPEVIRMMARDLTWTQDLGDAMLSQDGGVLAAVQRKRQAAYTAGNLVSNQAQQVDRQDDQIYIRPTDPDMVYIPRYDTSQVYTTPQAAAPVTGGAQNPLANPIIAGALAFGSAFLVSKFLGDDNDHNDDDEGDWGNYWDRQKAIDWRDRQVYARPHSNYGWRAERDRYWDRNDGRWRREAERDQRRIEAQRDAVRWLERDNNRRAAQLEELRRREREARLEADRLDKLQRERRREERLKDERREQRLEEKARQSQREERVQRQNDRIRAEENERRKEERLREAEREQRQQERAREERQQQKKDAALQEQREQRQAEQARAQREKDQARAAEEQRRQEKAARIERRKERAEAQAREAQSKQGARDARPQDKAGQAAKSEAKKQAAGHQGAEKKAKNHEEKKKGKKKHCPDENDVTCK
ncbi:MAG: DUF3300 domain-containing protein [Rhodobacteraceae bacterium]|nr:DUF3300 domain-containing protein [Paracoccaceae bacterium]